jgi:hypothetical protein
MRKFIHALIFAAMLLLPLATQGQRYFGIATSNWSGTNGVYLNPANLGDSRHKFSVDLFSLNAGVDNNFADAPSIRNIIDFFQEDKDNRNLGTLFNFDTSVNKYSLTGPNIELRGPGFMVSIGRKHGIALTTRARFMMQAHDVDGKLIRSVEDQDFANSLNTGYSAKAESFNVTAHGWSEIGLSYGGIVWENDKHQIKGGVTVRYLRGAGYFSMVNKNLDLKYHANTDSVTITNTDLQYGSNMMDGFDDFSTLLEQKGSGFGGDIGVVYEYRPNAAKYRYNMDGKTNQIDNGSNKYLLRFSAAITDIGSI